MACKSCRSHKTLPTSKTQVNVPDFSQRVPLRTSVQLSNGRMETLKVPLVTMQPPTGWGVTYRVGGTSYTTTGDSAHGIAAEVKKLYDVNKIPVTDDTIWSNLNLLWLRQSDRKARKVDLGQYVAIFNEADDTSAIPPQIWGAKGWGILQVYLSAEHYDPETFNDLLNVLASLLNDSKVGCEDCAKHFAQARLDLKVADSDQDAARQFVYETMNKVRASQGRHQLSRAQADKINYWT